MRLTLLNEKIIGEELAVSIYLPNGMIFANKGTTITNANLIILKNIGIDTVYIKDGNEDINLTEVIKTPLRLEITNSLKNVFDNIKKNSVVDEEKIMEIANKIINNLNVSENSFLLNNIGHKNEDFKLVTHSINVCILSLMVAIDKKYPKDKLEKLAIGALLHDVGKLFADGEEHCKAGYELIKSKTHIPVTSYMCIYQHHEYENGTGYPEKIKGDKIYEFSKIVSICDEYFNLLQAKKFTLPSFAIEYINSEVGTKFDSEIFKSFLNSVYCYPNGLYVKLTNGEQGVIVFQNKNFPTRPMVGIVKNGTPVIHNLMDNLSLFVQEVVL